MKNAGDERFSIGEVARCFGLRVSALRYYDEIRLLRPIERRGRVRYYGRDELRRLALIQHLHHGGLVSLQDVAVLLAEPPIGARLDGREVLSRIVRTLDGHIERLQTARAVLTHFLSCPTKDPVRQCSYLHDELDSRVDAALASKGARHEP